MCAESIPAKHKLRFGHILDDIMSQDHAAAFMSIPKIPISFLASVEVVLGALSPLTQA